MGRPSRYTTKLAETICQRIADGKGLAEVCREKGMPSRETVRKWLMWGEQGKAPYTGFVGIYARAREEQADSHADEVVEIADTEPDVNRARVRIDARKWSAAKRAPRKYGTDRIEHAGDPDAPLVAQIQRVNTAPKTALSTKSAERTPDA